MVMILRHLQASLASIAGKAIRAGRVPCIMWRNGLCMQLLTAAKQRWLKLFTARCGHGCSLQPPLMKICGSAHVNIATLLP